MGDFTPFGTYTNEPSVKTAAFKQAKKLSVCGITDPKYFLIKSGYSMIASDIEQKITPCCFNFLCMLLQQKHCQKRHRRQLQLIASVQ